jgi:hypothetical protein
MVAIYHAYYNFCPVHRTLRVTPAMEAGLTDHVWTLEELVGVMESTEAKGSMKKQIALLVIIFLISAAYAISAAKRLGFWGVVFFIFVWIAVFVWARSRKKS